MHSITSKRPKLWKIVLSLLLTVSAVSCSRDSSITITPTTAPAAEPTAVLSTDSANESTKDDAYAEALTFNNTAWQYDAENDIYWQIGVAYAATPAATEYETLGIYVPGAYLNATANGDGTYTAQINQQGTVNGFTAATAPIVLPLNTPGYIAQKAPTAYSAEGLTTYMEAGFIYVYVGMRGRENGYDANNTLIYSGGAPWGVTDLKAGVRYLRYNQSTLPGNTESIFVFGHSGGGAQSTLIGTTGDSELYFPYLESIGAAMYDANGVYISDSIAGVMAWCPITSLDYADAAYEWNMGQYATTDTRAEGTWTAALSKDLATSYANYINTLGITDENGNVLTLTASENGIYTSGSYYDYVVSTVEESLNNFLADTTFPYTQTAGGFMAGGNFAGGGEGMPTGGTPPTGMPPIDGTPPAGLGGQNGSTESVTYQTVEEYIAALNVDGEWVVYDAATNTATITSLSGFINSQKNATKSVAAFDDLNRSQAENNVFGNDQNDTLHFDVNLANLLTSNQETYAQYADWDASYVDAYTSDLQALDTLGNSIAYRMNAYNPMYYLLPFYQGYQTSKVAPYWRIRTGITQGDTATTVEMNLALALKNYSGVEDVDFATVWGQGHTKAERTGDSTTNFIDWVVSVTQK